MILNSLLDTLNEMDDIYKNIDRYNEIKKQKY